MRGVDAAPIHPIARRSFAQMGGINGFFISILQGIHSFVGNYGWSVVLFTLLIRFVLLPLDIKQRKNTRMMACLLYTSRCV